MLSHTYILNLILSLTLIILKEIEYEQILTVLVQHVDTKPAKTQCAAMRWIQVRFSSQA